MDRNWVWILEGKNIPIFASALATVAVSFSPSKGEFVGKESLLKQFNAFRKILDRDFSSDRRPALKG